MKIRPVVSPDAMCEAIRTAGIIPFFKGPVPGFSIEELTPPEHWFFSSDELGPWDWKIAAVQAGDIAYGKFLCGGKAAFATVEWYAHLHNWRMSLPQYEPDASGRKVLELAAEQGTVSSGEIRRLLGIKKAAADTVSAKLMSQTRLIIGDIERVYRGPSLKYSGWQHCSFCTPEALFGGDSLAAADAQSAPAATAPTVLFGGFSPFSDENPLDVGCSPQESLAALLQHLHTLLPDASEAALSRLLR